MTVATFDNNMASLICEIDDRKIYNDIRSQIDITVTTVILDAPAEYATFSGRMDFLHGLGVGYVPVDYMTVLPPGITRDAYLLPGKAVVTWVRVWAVGTNQEGLYNAYVNLTVDILERYLNMLHVSITNPFTFNLWTIRFYAEYTYQVQLERSHPETNIKTVTIQTQDNASILKYGRRTMSLVWPLGQTQQQMESLAEYYKQLYKEPKAYLPMTLQGKNDTLIQQILTLKISDRVTVINDRLGLNGNFFINSVDIFHDCHGLLMGDYLLEEIPTIQSATLFKLDVSALDGPHILG